MYHAFVRRKIRQSFAAVSQGDAEPIFAILANDFEHVFLGDSALGGKRTKLPATRLWYERLYRLLPDISFDVERIFVSGGPWNTLVVADWQETNSGTDGVRTYNRGLHVIQLRWGRVTRITICPDTAGLKATLVRLAASGNAEALAPPIVD